MRKRVYNQHQSSLTRFNRQFFNSEEKFTYIGSGELGGKAHGLASMRGVLQSKLGDSESHGISVAIPTLTVITTEYFDLFMKQNDLFEIAYSGKRDDLIAHEFQRATLPAQLVGDLRELIHHVHSPLAVRSSSMLEDAVFEPFANVYATKMIPNNQADTDSRFGKLVEAVKFIYASTFFKAASNYMKATRHSTIDEKMAVIIQEVVGTRFGVRFYPHISGVVRSYNFYPTGHATPEDGVVDLALGLGRIIVDEGISWSYSPAYPQTGPPFNSIGDLLKNSQTQFWAVNMSGPAQYDPIKETEYMQKYDLADGEYDGSLIHLASTYEPESDRITIGTGIKGPRVIDFGPILRAGVMPLNDLLSTLLKMCEDMLGTMVEIEFAVRLAREHCCPADFGFLQVRPMVVSNARVEVSDGEMSGEGLLLASEQVLGNGVVETVRDVVYLDPDRFDIMKTWKIASELEKCNGILVDEGKPYLLIGFGRWGTSDPLGGVPVDFGQISGAKVIVEASLPNRNFMLSQGSHFFHNVTSFKILYFSVPYQGDNRIDWDWLGKQAVVRETEYIRHIELKSPLFIKVDGRRGRGVILHER